MTEVTQSGQIVEHGQKVKMKIKQGDQGFQRHKVLMQGSEREQAKRLRTLKYTYI